MFAKPARATIRRVSEKRRVETNEPVPAPALPNESPKPNEEPTEAANEEPNALIRKPSPSLLMDVDLAPTSNVRFARSSSSLPPFLKAAGNLKAWEQLACAVKKRGVILLHGPTGCGKTRGVHDIAMRSLGMIVYEVNASSVRHPDEMEQKVRQVLRTKTLLGGRIVLIDDLEGFDEVYIDAVVKIVRDKDSVDGPMVITCVNPYDRALVALRPLPLTRVRMFSPPVDAMANAFATTGTTTPMIMLRRIAEHSMGNFHQLYIRLRSHCSSRPDEHVGLFETTHALLQRRVDVDAWMRSAEPQILSAIAFENYPTLAMTARSGNDEVTNAASAADVFSETADLSCEYQLETIGRAVKLRLNTPHPPALQLSKRIRTRGSFAACDIPANLPGGQSIVDD